MSNTLRKQKCIFFVKFLSQKTLTLSNGTNFNYIIQRCIFKMSHGKWEAAHPIRPSGNLISAPQFKHLRPFNTSYEKVKKKHYILY